MNTTLSDGSVDVQRLSYWHVGVFQESISILFNDCAQHRDISCSLEADLDTFALPCVWCKCATGGQ